MIATRQGAHCQAFSRRPDLEPEASAHPLSPDRGFNRSVLTNVTQAPDLQLPATTLSELISRAIPAK